ncbi:MAG: class I SAM-dependent RNA methyltransferase [Finegoldia magna]|nr:class I SAM-dependent RNA methyltransferase [Finegoldia magna]
MKIIVTCAFGLESLVKRQLLDMGYENLNVNDGRIMLECDEKDIAKLNINLRCADRVLIELGNFKAVSFEQLFKGVEKINWLDILEADSNFIVEGRSYKSKLFSIKDCQSITEKAIIKSIQKKYKVDWFSKSKGRFRIEVSLVKDICSITLDTSGDGLHKRGYREESVLAPIRENLAAGIIDLSFANSDRPLVDLFCGSGTFAIEAARKFRNIAPGIDRKFDFINFNDKFNDAYKQERTKALESIDYDKKIDIFASDVDGSAIEKAIANAENAGVREDIRFVTRDFRNVVLNDNYFVLISNPPYGKRLGERQEAEKIYKDLGIKMAKFKTASQYIITDCEEFEKFYGKKASKNRKMYNGNMKCYLYQYFGPRPK